MEALARKSALVLSGGGALGAAHAGVLQELARYKFDFDFIAGVSAGAIVAGMIACGNGPDKILEILRRTNFIKLSFDFSRTKFGLLRGKKIMALFTELYGDRRIEDLPMPLLIGATDFNNGERIKIRSGLLRDAVRASVSVPMLFEPFFHPGLKRWLVDGGLAQNFPVDWVIDEYAGPKIIAIDVATDLAPVANFAEKTALGRKKAYREAIVRTLRIFLKNQQVGLPTDARLLTIRPRLADGSASDVGRLEEFIERGRAAVRELEESGKLANSAD